jgi:hypothetical protein
VARIKFENVGVEIGRCDAVNLGDFGRWGNHGVASGSDSF